MQRFLQMTLMVALCAMVAIPATAQEKKKKKKGARQPQQIAQLMKRAEAANLDEATTAKVKEVAKEFAGKFAEMTKSRRDAIGADAMKAMGEARREAAKAGKKGKEAQEAVMAVLSDEQKAAFKETQEAQTKLNNEFKAKVTAAVGEENAKKLFGGRNAKGKKGKKKAE